MNTEQHIVELEDVENEEASEDITLSEVPQKPVAPSPIEWQTTENENDLRSLIFQTPDLVEQLVEVPEWRIKVLVRALTGKERTNLVKDCMQRDGTMDIGKLYPTLVVMTSRHPLTNKPIFKPSDRDMLLSKAGSVLDRIALVAAKISGLDAQSAQDAAKN